MTPRTARLREESLLASPAISYERASLLTDFYQANEGKFSVPVMRASSFLHLCRHKTLHLGPGELIVGERGPRPKAVPTYPELTCHSEQDLQILNSRPKTSYAVSDECLRVYREKIIPYWRGRSMRDKIFAAAAPEWKDAYEAGIFTEFMEQRAPGHTVLDGKLYRRGLLDFQAQIDRALAGLDFLADPAAYAKREQLQAMRISCDAVMHFAERHAELALEQAAREPDPARQAELQRIAAVSARVPAHAPRDFHEALQAYWFCHLAVITELNGWDSLQPGPPRPAPLAVLPTGPGRRHADAGPGPRAAGSLLRQVQQPHRAAQGGRDRRGKRHLHRFRQHQPGRPVGRRRGRLQRAVLTCCLEVIDEMHLLQPSSNLQLSRKTPEALLKQALRVIRQGYGFPSIFNADAVVAEQIRQGKTLEDARAGGCSGCVETGAFGKEAFILTGYFNLVKVLELALHDGVDPRSGKRLGTAHGPAGVA